MNTLPDKVGKLVTSVNRLGILKEYTAPFHQSSEELDDITSLVARQLNVPIALVSIVDMERQIFIGCSGLENRSTPVQQSFCAHAIQDKTSDIFIVRDAKKDKRFMHNPLVTGEPHIRFYAGVPIEIDEERLGTLCIIDTEPRDGLSENEKDTLLRATRLARSIIVSKTVSLRSDTLNKSLEREAIRHHLALRAANVASWTWDIETGEVEHDENLRELFNIDHHEPLGVEEILAAIHPEDHPRIEAELKMAMSDNIEYNSQFRTRNGDRWLIGQGKVMSFDAKGNPRTMAGVNADISEYKWAEQKTRLLLRELNHRIKNTLAMLQSIANQTLKSSNTQEEFNKAFSGRIRSIAQAHTLLSDEEWEPVALKSLIHQQVSAYVEKVESQLDISGKSPLLAPECALALGLVLHELATNAAKYGALSTPQGKVKIVIDTLVEEKKEFAVIDWQETGGPEVSDTFRRGFGTTMIERSLDRIIDSEAKLTFSPQGVNAHLKVPLKI